MHPDIFQSDQTQAIIQYVRETYGDELEFLWPSTPRNAIWRNPQNRKWYAVLLTVRKDKLGFTSDDFVEIIDLRFDQNSARDFATTSDHILPGYHMNKNNWITIILNHSLPTSEICALLDHSYTLVCP